MEIQGLQPHAAGLNGCAAPLSAACLFPAGFCAHICETMFRGKRTIYIKVVGVFCHYVDELQSPSYLTSNTSFVTCAGCKPVELFDFELIHRTVSLFLLSVTIIRGQTSTNTVTCFPLQWKQSGANACMWCLSAGSCHWPLSQQQGSVVSSVRHHLNLPCEMWLESNLLLDNLIQE